jgi:hypothetical protein
MYKELSLLVKKIRKEVKNSKIKFPALFLSESGEKINTKICFTTNFNIKRRVL